MIIPEWLREIFRKADEDMRKLPDWAKPVIVEKIK